jgi:hypothetical protein
MLQVMPCYVADGGWSMSGNIIDLVARRLGRAEPVRKAKVTRGYDQPRFLHMGMKVPRGGEDTVELCIVSNEIGKKRRILSRITVRIDDLRRLLREAEEEPRYTPQLRIDQVEIAAE